MGILVIQKSNTVDWRLTHNIKAIIERERQAFCLSPFYFFVQSKKLVSLCAHDFVITLLIF